MSDKKSTYSKKVRIMCIVLAALTVIGIAAGILAYILV
jgi:hypothetical protein